MRRARQRCGSAVRRDRGDGATADAGGDGRLDAATPVAYAQRMAKTSRLEMRIHSEKKELWSAAAALDGRSLTSWVEAVCDREINYAWPKRSANIDKSRQKKSDRGT